MAAVAMGGPVLARAAAPAPVNKWLVTVSIGMGSLMAAIDSSIVNVALPHIRGSVGATIQEITWVSTAYIVATVLVMPLAGFLGSLLGQKRLYLFSLVLFVIGSALCGVARTLPTLIAYRAIQGFGGGALQPTQQAILRQTFPPKEQGMAMAMFAMVIMVGPAVGPTLGGWITDNYSWPWIFYINVPIGVVGVFMTWRFYHEAEDVKEANRVRATQLKKSFDIAGIALLCVTVSMMQYVLEEGQRDDWFESSTITICTLVGGVAFAAFLIRELTAPSPVINLRLFKDPTFASGTVISGIMFAMLMGSMFLLPVFMEELLGFTATQSGVALMPRTLAMMAITPIIGRLYNHVPPALTVAFGVLLFVIGSYGLSHITLESSTTDIILPMVITGFGFACLFIPLTTASLSTIGRADVADAAGLNSFVRQIGGSIGLTIFATKLSDYTKVGVASIGAHVTALRPEVTQQMVGTQHLLESHGMDVGASQQASLAAMSGRVMQQASVLAFDKVFLLQGIAFIAVLPLLLFLRVKRTAEPVHVEMSME
ncbi:MAG: drug resistance transporter, EmrB/QacA subfamily [Labilithrix sp.]|nr:drug resistance transporter, EmrB/QacA subfamily [Labilithrix sp.]